jgi:hypothetical protein
MAFDFHSLSKPTVVVLQFFNPIQLLVRYVVEMSSRLDVFVKEDRKFRF